MQAFSSATAFQLVCTVSKTSLNIFLRGGFDNVHIKITDPHKIFIRYVLVTVQMDSHVHFFVHVFKQEKKIIKCTPHTDKYNANTYGKLILKGGN
jgi:hypothetical protein